MKEICRLGYKKAIEAISGTEKAYYKHGVWNQYNLRNTEDVIKSIEQSGYGADVELDENGIYYVSIPCDADMW